MLNLPAMPKHSLNGISVTICSTAVQYSITLLYHHCLPINTKELIDDNKSSNLIKVQLQQTNGKKMVEIIKKDFQN